MAFWKKRETGHLHLGPYAGFLLNSKAKDLDLDTTDEFKTADFGIAFGGRCKISNFRKTENFCENMMSRLV